MEEDITSRELYQRNDLTINLNTPPKGNDAKTSITTEIDFFSQKATDKFKYLLKLHPALEIDKEEPRIWSMTIILKEPINEE